jgi:hypothetical protein
VSATSSTERRLTSREQTNSPQIRSRDNLGRHKDAIIAQQAASRIDRPPPCPLPNARLSEAIARGDFMDLTRDTSNEEVFDTPLLRPSIAIAQGENRPIPLQRESAPVVGNPPLVEPAIETTRSKSGPVGNITTERQRRAKAQRDKIERLTVQRTDAEMMRMIREPISGVGELHNTGWTYVMQVEIRGRKLVKIGCTKDGAQKRADAITSKCGETVKVESVDDSGEIRFCERAEALAKLELKMTTYEFTCTCDRNTRHTEYFDVDYDTAVRVVRRWSTFCSLSPYNFAGQLSKIWSNRLRRKHVLRPTLVEPRKIGALLGTWDDFVYVPWTREVLDDLQIVVENFNDYGSPVCCMLFTLTLLQLWPNLMMLCFHALCIFWFSARTMTDNGSLSGHLFRKVFSVSLPWKERQLFSKGVESRIPPERSLQDPFDHEDSGTVVLEQLVPFRVPGTYQADLTL